MKVRGPSKKVLMQSVNLSLLHLRALGWRQHDAGDFDLLGIFAGQRQEHLLPLKVLNAGSPLSELSKLLDVLIRLIDVVLHLAVCLHKSIPGWIVVAEFTPSSPMRHWNPLDCPHGLHILS